jgi:endoglycosylceramidase
MCPGDTDGRPTEEFLDVLGRGYPRATPGRLNSLTSSPSDGTMRITATASTPGVALWVWTPTTSTTHKVEVTGLTAVTEHPVKGGRLIEARVASAGEYSLTVSPKP